MRRRQALAETEPRIQVTTGRLDKADLKPQAVALWAPTRLGTISSAALLELAAMAETHTAREEAGVITEVAVGITTLPVVGVLHMLAA